MCFANPNTNFRHRRWGVVRARNGQRTGDAGGAFFRFIAKWTRANEELINGRAGRVLLPPPPRHRCCADDTTPGRSADGRFCNCLQSYKSPACRPGPIKTSGNYTFAPAIPARRSIRGRGGGGRRGENDKRTLSSSYRHKPR